MRKYSWQLTLGAGLVALSALLYFIHYLIFRDTHHIAIYFLGDVAFVPIEVLLVTLIIEEVLSKREKRISDRNLQMMVGVFYHEVGASLLKLMRHYMPAAAELNRHLEPAAMVEWSETDYARKIREVEGIDTTFLCEGCDLTPLRDFLNRNQELLLRMLENPNLSGNDELASMLWAITHISDELHVRPHIENLGHEDAQHVKGDFSRAYDLLLVEWLKYVVHLKREYPFMYLAALRYGPFAPGEDDRPA
ncbi:MAG: hypothetical protein C4534_10525 [Gaiellales bacterium]|nr:MAG: hypothetical protein C4534_10525 [Gaiellales bacterium]